MQNFQSAEKNKLKLTKNKSKKSLKNKRKWMTNNSLKSIKSTLLRKIFFTFKVTKRKANRKD